MNKVNITKMIIHADATREALYTIGRREGNNKDVIVIGLLSTLAWKLKNAVDYIKEEGSQARLIDGIYHGIPDTVTGEVYESILDTINELKDWHGMDIEEELKDTIILVKPERLADRIKDLGLDDFSSMYPNADTLLKQSKDEDERLMSNNDETGSDILYLDQMVIYANMREGQVNDMSLKHIQNNFNASMIETSEEENEMKPISIILLEEYCTNLNEMILEVAASIDKYKYIINTTVKRNIREWHEDAIGIDKGYHVFGTDVTRERLLNDYSGVVRDYYNYKLSNIDHGDDIGVYIGSELFRIFEEDDMLVIAVERDVIPGYRKIPKSSSVDDIVKTAEEIISDYRKPIEDDSSFDDCMEEFATEMSEFIRQGETFEHNGVEFKFSRDSYNEYMIIKFGQDTHICSYDLSAELTFKECVPYKLLRDKLNWDIFSKLRFTSKLKEFNI